MEEKGRKGRRRGVERERRKRNRKKERERERKRVIERKREASCPP